MSEWNYALLHGPVLGLPAVLLRPWPLSSTAQTACVLHPGDEAAEAELAQDDEAMAEVATALQRVDMTFLKPRPTFYQDEVGPDVGPAMQALLNVQPDLFKYPDPVDPPPGAETEAAGTSGRPASAQQLPNLPADATEMEVFQWALAHCPPVHSPPAHCTPVPRAGAEPQQATPVTAAAAATARAVQKQQQQRQQQQQQQQATPLQGALQTLHPQGPVPHTPAETARGSGSSGAGTAPTVAAHTTSAPGSEALDAKRAAKRQRRESDSLPQYEEAPKPALPPEVKLAQALQQLLSQQVARNRSCDEAQQGDVGSGDEQAGDSDKDMSPGGSSDGGVLPAPTVRELCDQLLAARSGGLLQRLALPLVQTLLAALHRTMGQASHKALDVDSTSGEVAEVTGCLDAALASLYVLASAGMPPEVYREEHVERVLGVFKYHLQNNVLAPLDMRCARLWRPSLLREGAKPKGGRGASKGGRGAKATNAAGLQKGVTSALLTRVEQASLLLGELMSRLQLGTGLLLPMLRIVLTSLTVDGVAVYQVQASALIAAAFKCQPSLRQPLLDELHSAVFPFLYPSGARAPPRHLLVRGPNAGSNVSIQMCVGLVLQLMQSMCDLPDSDADVTAAYKQCHQQFNCVDYFWNGMLNGLQGAKATKADTSLDGRVFWEAFLQDLMAVQTLPEWPAATLLLTRCVTLVKSDKGVQHADPYVRQLSLELLGQVAARIVREHKQAEGEAAQVQALARVAARVLETDPAAGGEEAVEHQPGDRQAMEAEDGEQEAAGPQHAQTGMPANAPVLLQQLLLRYLLATPKDGKEESAITYIASNMLRDRLTDDAKAALACAGRDTAKTKEGVLLLAPGSVSQLIISYRALLDPKLARQAAAVSAAAADASAATLQATVDARLQLPPAPASSSQPAGRGGKRPRVELDVPSVGLTHTSTPSMEVWRLPVLTREQAVMVCRWLLVHSTLGRARAGMLGWLVDAGDRSKQDGSAAQVRAKAVKALGHAVDEDVRVLGLAEVQKAVEGALQDDSVLVREAAVELVGRYISRSRDLAVAYFPVVSAASVDIGLSVRKRALKVLWDCCVRCAGFPMLGEALLLIMARASDQEDSMRKQAAALCAELWFTPGSALPGDELLTTGTAAPAIDDLDTLTLTADRSPASRAKMLMGVCWAVQQSDGKLNVPPGSDSAVVAMLRTVLLPAPATPQDKESAARSGAREVVSALVDHYLELHAASGDSSAAPGTGAGAGAAGHGVGDQQAASAAAVAPVRCLMALAAIAQTDADLLMPPGNVTCYVKRLSLYLKDRAPANAGAEVTQVHNTRMLSLLTALLPVISRMGHIEPQLADSMCQDLGELIRNSLWPLLVDKACQCLCALVRLRPSQAARVQDLARRYYRSLDRAIAVGRLDAKVCAFCVRFLVTLGLLCRSGAHIMDTAQQQDEASTGPASISASAQTASTSLTASGLGLSRSTSTNLGPAASGAGQTGAGAEGADTAVSSAACLSLFLAYFVLPASAGGTMRLRDSAMQAMGNLFVARPVLMVEHAAVMPVLEEVLTPSSTPFSHSASSTVAPSVAGTGSVLGPEGSVGGTTAAVPCASVQGGGEGSTSVLGGDSMFSKSQRMVLGTGQVPLSRCSELKVRVLANLVDLLKAEEQAMQGRQAQASQALAAAGGSGNAAAVLSPASAATWASKGAGAAEGTAKARARPGTAAGGAAATGAGGLISRVNGEGDGCSITGSVVQRLWPRILALAREEPVLQQQPPQQPQQPQQGPEPGASEAQGKAHAKRKQKKGEEVYEEEAPEYPLSTPGSAVRRRVLELIDVVQRGGLTAPWQAVAPLIALSMDPDPVTAAGAVRTLKQCVDKHADFVGGELAAGLVQAYLLQRNLWAAHHPDKPFGKRLPMSVAESLSALWQVVLQPVQSLKTKTLMSLTRPFEDATNVSGAGALQGDPGLMWFLAWMICHLPFKRMDEPLLLVSVAAAVVARRGEVVLAELKDALKAEHGDDGEGAGAGRGAGASGAGAEAGAQGLEGVAASSAAGQQVQRQGSIPAASTGASTPGGADKGQWHQQQRAGSVSLAAGSSAQTVLRTPRAGASPWKSAAPSTVTSVPGISNRLVAAVKAACSMSLLLLLKHHLTDAYRLQDERVAAYAAATAPGKKTEAKAVANKDAKIQCALHVVDLEAFRDVSREAARKECATLAYLLKQDVYKGSSSMPLSPRHNAHAGAAADGEDDAEAGAPDGRGAGDGWLVVSSSLGAVNKKPKGRLKAVTKRGKAGAKEGAERSKGQKAGSAAKVKKRKRQGSDTEEEDQGAEAVVDDDEDEQESEDTGSEDEDASAPSKGASARKPAGSGAAGRGRGGKARRSLGASLG